MRSTSFIRLKRLGHLKRVDRMKETKKQVDDRSKEIKRRSSLPEEERRTLAKEDEKELLQKKIAQAEKIDGRLKDRDKQSVVVQAAIDVLAEEINKLIEQDLITYEMLLNPDCLYHDSPLSRAFMYEWIKQYMLKKDMDFIGGVYLDGKVNIKDFADRSQEASKWALRFTKQVAPEKTGLEAIL